MSRVVVLEQDQQVAVSPSPDVLIVQAATIREIDVPGPPGPAGPPGPTGSTGGVYVHDQAVPDTVWTITHNLGIFPNVTVVDSAGTEVVGQVAYVSSNQITVTFTAAFAGKAYLS